MKFSGISLISLGLIGLVNAACNSPFSQCGGNNFKGETCCPDGFVCKFVNEWYSQCVQGSSNTGNAVNPGNNFNNAPVNNAPINNAPVNNAPVNNAPVNNAPVNNAPVNNAPVNNAPVNNAPVNNVPVNNPTYSSNGAINNNNFSSIPTGNGPVNNAPVNNAPVNNAPVNNAPVNNAPVNNVPANNSNGPKQIFIAGDSTGDSASGYNGKTVGWGKFLSNYVTATVHNHAKSGRSARSFWREGRWRDLISGVKEGDYVFIQFGHNDGGGPNHAKERGCANGSGNETVTVKLSNGETEVVHTFPWYLRQMVNQVKEKKAHPVLLTHTPRKIFNNGKIETPGRFQEFALSVAKELSIPCIDLFNYIGRQYESIGENTLNSKGWFPADYLHTSPEGADFNVQVLVNVFSNCEKIPDLISVLNDKGKSINLKCAK